MTTSNLKQPKILLTGGGTGGHIFPLMVVAEQLKDKANLLFVGSWSGLEKNLTQKAGFRYRRILVGKWRRYFSFWNLIDIFKTAMGFFQALWIIVCFWPDIIFAKGGYVTMPLILASWILHRRVITHESDITMGLANRFQINFARKVCVGYPVENYPGIPIQKLIYTGVPVRPEFFSPPQPPNSRPVLLVMGGSQGSHTINVAIANILPELVKDYQVIHLGGKGDFPWLSKLKFRDYKLYDFVDDEMPDLVRQATLVVSRAGAGALAEIAAAGKPSILIPLESAASGHQNANGQFFLKQNAAVVISQKNLSPFGLLDIIRGLIKDPSLLEMMSQRVRQLSEPKSAQMLAGIILGQIKK